MLIYVRDAADLKLCLLLRSFFADEGGNPDYSRASDRSTLHEDAKGSEKRTVKDVTCR
jgi:hypothetical protein